MLPWSTQRWNTSKTLQHISGSYPGYPQNSKSSLNCWRGRLWSMFQGVGKMSETLTTCFVAHTDSYPSTSWLFFSGKIENNLWQPNPKMNKWTQRNPPKICHVSKSKTPLHFTLCLHIRQPPENIWAGFPSGQTPGPHKFAFKQMTTYSCIRKNIRFLGHRIFRLKKDIIFKWYPRWSNGIFDCGISTITWLQKRSKTCCFCFPGFERYNWCNKLPPKHSMHMNAWCIYLHLPHSKLNCEFAGLPEPSI